MEFIASEIAKVNMKKYMREALREAELAGQAGEIPIGAVIVIDDMIISRGRARRRELKSQLQHAELNAMLNGGDSLWQDYERAILFTTVEPCPLCLGAAVMADIPHIIFALHDKGMQSGHTIETNSYVKRHIKSYFGGILVEKSVEIFSRYDPQALKYIQKGNAQN